MFECDFENQICDCCGREIGDDDDRFFAFDSRGMPLCLCFECYENSDEIEEV